VYLVSAIGGERFGKVVYSTMGRIMSASVTLPVAIASSLALISLGGGVYEFLVIDPFWPRRPDIIQPNRGGISRRQFWIPAHTAFELALIAALVMAWSLPDPGTITESTARRWTRRSLRRLPLDMVTCASMLPAFAAAVLAP
jgi:hypothetical protein